MRGLLFLPLLWVIGYLVNGGEFGANVINGFAWLNTFYAIMLWIVGIIAALLLFALTLGSSQMNNVDKAKTYIIGGAGTIVMMLSVASTIFYYWLTDKIVHLTNAAATQWSELGTTDYITIYIVIVVIMMIVGGRSKS